MQEEDVRSKQYDDCYAFIRGIYGDLKLYEAKVDLSVDFLCPEGSEEREYFDKIMEALSDASNQCASAGIGVIAAKARHMGVSVREARDSMEVKP